MWAIKLERKHSTKALNKLSTFTANKINISKGPQLRGMPLIDLLLKIILLIVACSELNL